MLPGALQEAPRPACVSRPGSQASDGWWLSDGPACRCPACGGFPRNLLCLDSVLPGHDIEGSAGLRAEGESGVHSDSPTSGDRPKVTSHPHLAAGFHAPQWSSLEVRNAPGGGGEGSLSTNATGTRGV